MSINSCVFSGNLAADPRKGGNEDSPILNFTVAVTCSKRVNGEWVDEPLYQDCVIFGNRAKSLADILVKGMPVTVAGRMNPDNYEKDGTKVYRSRLNVSDIQLPRREDKPAKGGKW